MSWNQPNTQEPSFVPAELSDARVGTFLTKVYAWMFAGLLITAMTAFGIATSPALIETLILNRIIFWGLLFAQLGVVFYLSAKVNSIAPETAAALFILYSALVGVTSSVIL